MNLDPETTTLMATLSRVAHRLARSPPEQSASLDLEDAAAAAAVSGVSEATRRLSHSHSDMGLRQEDGDKDHHHHHLLFLRIMIQKPKGEEILKNRFSHKASTFHKII